MPLQYQRAPLADPDESPFDESNRALQHEGNSALDLKRGILSLLGLLLPLLLFTTNPTLSLAAHLELMVFIALLWTPRTPPFLAFAWGMQWLQCAISIYYHDFLGVSIADDPLPYLGDAIWSALYSSMLLGIGIWVSTLWARKNYPVWNPDRCNALNIQSLAGIYIAFTVASSGITYVAWSFPAITQIIVAFNDGRWAIIYLLFLTILIQRRGYLLLSIVLAFEVFIGFMGYFSEFKTVLYALVLAVLSLPGRRVASLLMFPILIVGVVLSIYWSAIKMEYRTFLNKGSAQQVVLVSNSEKVARLAELVSSVNSETIAAGVEATVKRISYVELLSRTMAYVPASTPHENGKLWKDAVEHVLVPRFLNPNKASLDDSEITRRYTGMRIGGRDEGTSIGLGYMTESYVDFGRGWMAVPCLLVGLWLGFLYRFFLKDFFFQPLGAGLLFVSIALNANTIAISSTKLMGGQVMMFAVYTPLLFFISKSLRFKLSEDNGQDGRDVASDPLPR